MKKITSESNPLVKTYLKLLQGKDREGLKLKKMAVEGFNLLEEALKQDFNLEILFYCPQVASRDSLQALLRKIPPKTRLVEITPSLLKRITLTETPQGVAGVVACPSVSRDDILQASPSGWVVLDSLQDPGNLGTIIRTAAGAGFPAVICTPGTVNPFNPKVLRSSAGGVFHLKIWKTDSPGEVVKELKKQGVMIVSLELSGEKAYYQVDFTGPTAILVGNERSGVSPELSELADCQATIPLKGDVDSLNASVAAGIVMFEARRQNQN